MPADDLAAADAVDVGEHDVEGLDVGMRVEEGRASSRLEPEGESADVLNGDS